MRRRLVPLPFALALLSLGALGACRGGVAAGPGVLQRTPDWERDSPPRPLPAPPLGMEVDLARTRVKLTPEKVRLGRWLFFDPRLSKDHTISCASCHDPRHAFADVRARSLGVGGQEGTRKAPPVVNVAFQVSEVFFWDGRARTLAEQAEGPLTNPVEMASTAGAVVATVASIPGYRRLFREVYGDDRLDLPRITDAIAAYETTRLSGGSAYDRFNAGEEGALSAEARRGLELFFGRGRCNACHLGPTFSDARFHNVGIGYRPPDDWVRTGFADPGRQAISGDPADTGAFKTPTLRDVARHPPYLHDGSALDLTDAVLRYVQVPPNPWLDPAMGEVHVDAEDVAPLVAFLEALDGTGYEDVPPATFPR